MVLIARKSFQISSGSSVIGTWSLPMMARALLTRMSIRPKLLDSLLDQILNLLRVLQVTKNWQTRTPSACTSSATLSMLRQPTRTWSGCISVSADIGNHQIRA